MNITPDYYTERSGGRWLPWTFGELKNVPSIHSTKYKTAIFRVVKPAECERKKGIPYVDKEVMITLHSFAVGNPIGTPTGSYIRWDSFNGFTTSPEDVAAMNEDR